MTALLVKKVVVYLSARVSVLLFAFQYFANPANFRKKENLFIKKKENICHNNVQLVKFSKKTYLSGNEKAHLSRASKLTSLIATASKYDGIGTKLVLKKKLIISNYESE
jgi:hypothetical protein